MISSSDLLHGETQSKRGARGAWKDLLPHAAAEPIYWSKPFELELFTLLEAVPCNTC